MINIKQFLSTLDLFKDQDLEALEGTDIKAEIPFSESLINFVMEQKAESTGMVEKMQLVLPGNNQLRILVKAKVPTGMFGIKIPVNKNILLELDPEIAMSPSPVLKMRILEGLSGLEKALINWFENLISRSVPGDVNIGTDTITIDLDSFVRENGWEIFVEKIKNIRIEGRKEQLVIKTWIRV